MSTSRWCALFVLGSLSLPTSRALAWPTLDETTAPTAMLGGRWTLVLGPDASTAAAAADPRGPAARVELDGIAAVRDDDGRLVVRGTLLYATAPEDLEAVVRGLPAPCENAITGPFEGHPGVVSIACTTPSPDGAFRPLVLFATHTDGWVDRFEVQLDLDEASDRDAAIAFATSVAQTLTAAEVAPAVEHGTVTIGDTCAEQPFTVALPEDWVGTRIGGEGTTILQLLRVIPLGQPRPLASIVLSSAGAPPSRIPRGASAPHPGQLLGSPVEWLEVRSPEMSLREVALDLTVTCAGGTPWTGMMQLSAGGPESTLDASASVLETVAFGGASTALHIGALETEEDLAPEPDTVDADDAAASQSSHTLSMMIGGVSLAVLAIALVMRARGQRTK